MHRVLFAILVLLAVFALPFGPGTGGIAATARAENALVFDRHSNSWVRKPGAAALPKVMRSNASPIPRQVVEHVSSYKAGTIIVDTGARRLLRILDGRTALQYAIGVGREGFEWKGQERISRKAEWPGWTPPAEMRAREAANGRILPAYMEGGPDNPLGARAIYLGNTLYRIHGTNQPWTIGQAVSSGCIRMANDDVVHLYEQARIGDLVVVR